jgi:hypothetical protein
VSKIRPPLHNNSWGTALGIREPTGQIHFTYTNAEYDDMVRLWNEDWSRRKKILALRLASPFFYVAALSRPAESVAAPDCSAFGPG